MTEILMSVVVPVYNVEKYLPKCLNSLVKQTLDNIEIIVVNDGTKDRSQVIIDEYAKKYPQKIVSLIKKNGGLSDARNFGMRYCKGKYIGFVDSDDYVEPSMYELMYKEAVRGNWDIVACDYVKEYKHKKQIVTTKEYRDSKSVFINMYAAATNKIYKRSMVQNNNIVFPKGLIYEDTDFFCKLLPHVNGVGHVDRVLYHYVQRDNSIVYSQKSRVMDIKRIFRDVKNYYIENGFYSNYEAEIEYLVTKVMFGSSFERVCRIANSKLRKAYIYQSYVFINKEFPKWKQNEYLKPLKIRNLYIRSINKNTIRLYGGMIHLVKTILSMMNK